MLESETIAPPEAEVPQQTGSGRAARVALRFLQLGVVAVAVAVTTHKAFELDRFFIPKELVLHVTAVLAGLLSWRALRRVRLVPVDLFLIAYLILGLVSTLAATNVWVGVRALAVSVSCVAIFWIARALRDAGFARPILVTVAFAIVVAAVTSLLQAYGIESDLFSVNRSPGGTLGNRNFVGHGAAFGLPVVMFAALTARRFFGFLGGAAGTAIVMGALVLTRSRGAWLAAVAALFILGAAMLAAPAMRRDGRTWRRLIALVVLAGAGIVAVLLIPNTLRWRSDNPYLDSVTTVAEYDEGSGRGRLVQYERSLRMAVANPLFGVGPGNWPVRYPEFAAGRDPSMNGSAPGTTFNPWPSSDWVAFVSERGIAATIALALVFTTLALSALKKMISAADVSEATSATALLATLAAACLAGAFDAVLLLAMPSMLVWTAAGAASSVPETPGRTLGFLPLFVIIAALLGGVRSAGQIAAMEHYGSRPALAARLDPGNYRIHLRLAHRGSGRLRCAHAEAAHRLFPNAVEAKQLARRCGQ